MRRVGARTDLRKPPFERLRLGVGDGLDDPEGVFGVDGLGLVTFTIG